MSETKTAEHDRPVYILLSLLGTLAMLATVIAATLYRPFPPLALVGPFVWGFARIGVWALRFVLDRTMRPFEVIMAAIGIAVLVTAFRYLAVIQAALTIK